MKISRNAPCPCNSGKKYKQCHLGKRLPGEEMNDISGGPVHSNDSKLIRILIGLGLLFSTIAGVMRDDLITGFVVALGWTFLCFIYLNLRNPPPVNENAGDPAALNFGRSNDQR